MATLQRRLDRIRLVRVQLRHALSGQRCTHMSRQLCMLWQLCCSGLASRQVLDVHNLRATAKPLIRLEVLQEGGHIKSRCAATPVLAATVLCLGAPSR